MTASGQGPGGTGTGGDAAKVPRPIAAGPEVEALGRFYRPPPARPPATDCRNPPMFPWINGTTTRRTRPRTCPAPRTSGPTAACSSHPARPTASTCGHGCNAIPTSSRPSSNTRTPSNSMPAAYPMSPSPHSLCNGERHPLTLVTRAGTEDVSISRYITLHVLAAIAGADAEYQSKGLQPGLARQVAERPASGLSGADRPDRDAEGRFATGARRGRAAAAAGPVGQIGLVTGMPEGWRRFARAAAPGTAVPPGSQVKGDQDQALDDDAGTDHRGKHPGGSLGAADERYSPCQTATSKMLPAPGPVVQPGQHDRAAGQPEEHADILDRGEVR